MKKLLLIGMLALTFVAGCVVMSVHPFYTEKQVVFDAALLGVWSDPEATNEDRETWTFERSEAQAYKFTTRDSSDTNQFDARLFKLGGVMFPDCLNRERRPYSSPNHILLRVDRIEPRLETRPLDCDWLGKLLEKKPETLRHVIVTGPSGEGDKEKQLVLTADTAELQKFILKHLKTEDAWSDEMTQMKQR